MERLETGNIGIGNTSTLATLSNDRIAPTVGRGVPPSRPPPADAACAPFPRTMAFVFPNIAPCSAARCVLHYRRFRELMPSVGLYSESRPDGTHAWSAWDPLGPGSEILR